MYDVISNRAGTSKAKAKLDSVGSFLELNGGVRWYMLAIALTDGLTTTAPVGSLGTTSHATGKGGLWRVESLDGGTTKKWFRADKGYRSYVAVLNQAGTAAPTLGTALENQLGGVPVPTRTSAGLYPITLTGAFAKIMVNVAIENAATGFSWKATRTSDDVVTLAFLDAAGAAADLVGNAIVEIKVYP